MVRRVEKSPTANIAPADCNYSQMRFQTGRDAPVAFGSRDTAVASQYSDRRPQRTVGWGRDHVGELP